MSSIPGIHVTNPQLPDEWRGVAKVAGLAATFLLSAGGAFALTMNVVFNDSFHAARYSLVLIGLTLAHLMRYQKIVFVRESAIYGIFLLYMSIQLFWSPNPVLAMNTITPALAFILTLIFFGSLCAYHKTRAVLSGVLAGVIGGAIVYTWTSGFPFRYPAEFSYNAFALMYLFGFFVAILLNSYARSKSLLLIVALIFLAHIVATTSIKTNLGLALGAVMAGVFYFQSFARLLRRNIVPLVVLGGLLGYTVASNESLVSRLEGGMNRITLGVEILQARDDLPGYTGFASRANWRELGLDGWARNPVFGNGVESFRSRFGITSHSTPIDLLHNSGLIGFVLFYSIFASLIWRLYRESRVASDEVRLLIFSLLICFLFISMSGNVHYNSILAAFLAIGAVVLSNSPMARSPSGGGNGAAVGNEES